MDNNHGGRSNYSTLTAKGMLDYIIGKSFEKYPLTTLINTDMSSAFDTVDVCTLIRKLQYYSVSQRTLELLTSLLSYRTSSIELEGVSSDALMLPLSSVMQGSKLLGILFLIYINEVPLLHELLEEPELARKFLVRIIY